MYAVLITPLQEAYRAVKDILLQAFIPVDTGSGVLRTATVPQKCDDMDNNADVLTGSRGFGASSGR